MSAKHQTAEYQRNAKLRRQQVAAAHRAGEPVQCWRCGTPIFPGQPFDIGHRINTIESPLEALAPEHRHKTRHCIGNRSEGGARGAALTNARHAQPKTGKVRSWTV